MDFKDFVKTKDNEIIEYIKYKAYQDNISIDEAAARSLGRLFGQVQSSDNLLIIITAFRNERKLPLNRSLNKQLANDIRQLGWGYVPVLGGFYEKTKDDEGNEKEIRVHEESLFVNASGNVKQILSHVVNLLNKYQQESAIVKLPSTNQASLLSSTGELIDAGKWKTDPELMAKYYTRMRKGAPNRQFTFEAAGDDSRTTRMIVDAFLTKR